MKKNLFVLSFLIISAINTYSQVNTEKEITRQELKEHISILASEEFQGRKPGTEGDVKSAKYIKSQLDALNITPLYDNGFQYFEVTTSVSVGENSLSVNGTSFIANQDFAPLAFSENQNFSGEIVFAGYGIVSKDDSFKWDDYANIDVTGKAVLILRGIPSFDSSKKLQDYSTLIKKAYTAKDKGAKAIIFVTGQMFEKDDILIPLAYEGGQNPIGIPVINITRKTADAILSSVDGTIAALESNINSEKSINSLELGISVNLKTEIIKNKVKTQNIAYLLKGNDPILNDEYIVIGAHFDHLGMGGKGTGTRVPDTVAIHYGADDNASGVASIIELIEKLSANRVSLKRSIIFCAFSAEEMGLLGSKYFVNNPPVDIKKIKLMLNLDMVGRLDEQTNGLTIGGAGTAVDLTKELEELAKGNNNELFVKFSPEGYGPSDHASFYSKDISVLFFFSGIHDDYHTPRDIESKINYKGQKSISDFAYNIVNHYANKSESIVFTESGPKEQTETRRSFKVTLGIMPDVAGSEIKGVKADAVIEGRPAAKGGMKKGDIIIGMEGKPVGDIYEYMNRLSEFKAGQRITVEVLRDNKKVLLIVEL